MKTNAHTGWGGKREGSGRKRSEVPKHKKMFYVSEEEEKILKECLSMFRKRKEIKMKEIYTSDSPDMQVASWTDEKTGKHFLEISGRFGNTYYEAETTEEIDAESLTTTDFKTFEYKGKDLKEYIV